MQRAWQLTGAAFAVLFALWAHQSWRLSLTDALGPGPGFFPFWLSLIGFALSIALIARTRRNSDADTQAAVAGGASVFPRAAALRQILVILGALAGVALLLETLGFRLVMAVFCLLVLPALGARNWLVIAIFAAAASIGVHALFSDLLKVPLPIGVFEI